MFGETNTIYLFGFYILCLYVTAFLYNDTNKKLFFYLFHLDQKPSSLVNQSVSSSFAFAVMIMLMQLISVIPGYFICTCLLKCTKVCFGFCFRLQGLYGKSQQWMGI